MLRAMSVATAAIRTARRVDRFTYAIRNIVAEARKVEAGRHAGALFEHRRSESVRVPHAAASDRGGGARHARRPQRLHGVGRHRRSARGGRRRFRRTRRAPCIPDRVLITSGTSEGLELALTAIVDEGEAVLVPSPTYPLYTAVLAKIGAEPQYYRTDPHQSLAARPRRPARRITPTDARARGHRSEQPDRRDLSGRGPARADRDRRGARPRDPRRRGVRRPAYDGPVAADGDARSRRGDHFVFEPVEGVSRAGLAGGVDGGRRDAAARRRAGRDQEAGRRPVVQPRSDAIRRRRRADRRPIASGDVPAPVAAARAADDRPAERDRRDLRAWRRAARSTRCRR